MRGLFNIVWFIGVWVVVLTSTSGVATPLLLVQLLCTYLGGKGREKKAREQIGKLLIAGEDVYDGAMQRRVYALWSRRDLVVVTDSRIVILRRGLFGSFKMQDIQWKDLRDVTVSQNNFPTLNGANLRFVHASGYVAGMHLEGVDSDLAQKIYAHSQGQEQVWEEKLRMRGIQEDRIWGGISRGGDMQPEKVEEQLRAAKKLLDDGLISDVEYEAMKAKILTFV